MTKARSSSSRSKQGEMKKGEKRMKEEDFKSEIKEKKEVRRLPSWILHPSWKQSSWYIRIDWGGNTKKLLIMYYTAALLPFVYNNNTESPAEKGRLCVPEFQLKWTACCCCTLNVNQARWRSRWIPRRKKSQQSEKSKTVSSPRDYFFFFKEIKTKTLKFFLVIIPKLGSKKKKEKKVHSTTHTCV